jgi:hypothetical protein
MSTAIEKRRPLYLWRAWDADWQQVGQWDKQPAMSELVEGGGLTVDWPDGHRWSWYVRNGQLVRPMDLMPVLVLPSNPIFEPTAGGTP